MPKKELICIVCPKGCHLMIDEDMNVTGNGCNRGIKYGIDELTNPTRMVTSTVVILNGEVSRLPVVTEKPIPKDKIMEVMQEINKVRVEAPIHIKDVIIPNILGLGINVLAARDVLIKKNK